MVSLESVMSGLKNGESREKLWHDLAEIRLRKAKYHGRECRGVVKFKPWCIKCDQEVKWDDMVESNPDARLEVKPDAD